MWKYLILSRRRWRQILAEKKSSEVSGTGVPTIGESEASRFSTVSQRSRHIFPFLNLHTSVRLLSSPLQVKSRLESAVGWRDRCGFWLLKMIRLWEVS